MKKFKRIEMVVITFPMQKKLNFLENSFMDGESRQFDKRVAFASILMT
jgi:hypothetical protein